MVPILVSGSVRIDSWIPSKWLLTSPANIFKTNSDVKRSTQAQNSETEAKFRCTLFLHKETVY